MNKNMRIFVCLLSIGLAGNLYASIALENPFTYFNVYSLNNIGSSTSAYGSDFQGVTGAAGDVYFSNFSLEGYNTTTGYVLHVGGNATLSGSYKGNIDVGGNISLGSVSVKGDINVGGNASNFSGGSVKGNVTAGGTADFSNQLTVKGTVSSNAGYSTAVDHASLIQYFLNQSSTIAGMAATGSYTNNYGGLVINAISGINIINITAAELQSAWGVTINAPEDAVVYFNVSGTDVALNWITWTYVGGITAGDVLLNFADATTLTITGGGIINILAPLADTTFTSGVLTGNLIVGNLTGSGQVNEGYFEHQVIPEPATLAILCMGGIFVLHHKRKRCPV